MPTTTPTTTLPLDAPITDTLVSPSIASPSVASTDIAPMPTASDAATPTYTSPAGLVQRLLGSEVIRFLMVGVVNTLFSYILYAAIGALLTRIFPTFSQVLIADVAQVCTLPFGITFSFLNFKHFVFRTKGNYLKEWLRCAGVYSLTLPATLIITGVATRLFLLTSMPHDYAKYAAGIVNAGLIAGYSYFANKKFSFRK